ncbi:hypothetical protein FOL47_004315 [Perkinsus chesapeaki]|uniref:Uncharacterized protein n=1 Tax=Perkinsus chesapeaki TaxID=330153 RepID=A0A7J6M368_PERCH|nr:hypothetical protein FOL47_004315 [Perkinsus chesapeaki]
MRYLVISLCILALAEEVFGESKCPSGDDQCNNEHPGSYCKYWQRKGATCQYTDTACSCTTPSPTGPSPTGIPCPDGTAYCQQQTGDMSSYCKAAYTQGSGGVCQGGNQACTCGGSTTSEPTTSPVTPTHPPQPTTTKP